MKEAFGTSLGVAQWTAAMIAGVHVGIVGWGFGILGKLLLLAAVAFLYYGVMLVWRRVLTGRRGLRRSALFFSAPLIALTVVVAALGLQSGWTFQIADVLTLFGLSLLLVPFAFALSLGIAVPLGLGAFAAGRLWPETFGGDRGCGA